METEQALAELHNAAVEVEILCDLYTSGTVGAALRKAVEHVNAAVKLVEYAQAKAVQK